MNRPTCRVHTNIVMASLLLLLTIAAISIDSSYAFPHCVPCPDGICNDEGPCIYNFTLDNCGRKICKRGPDEECGGHFLKLRGKCGDGLTCRCGRCQGCSTDTMECSMPDFYCKK
ncbi:hypothetical protein B566_EDAN009562 [Ephemera danica]|nr:hypothetical protein B566_EDAN009562 [Ephemera danica]